MATGTITVNVKAVGFNRIRRALVKTWVRIHSLKGPGHDSFVARRDGRLHCKACGDSIRLYSYLEVDGRRMS